MGWTAYLPKLGKILDITSLGIYSILINAAFDFYIGIKAVIDGKVNLVTYEDADSVTENLAFFTGEPVSFTIGVFAMAFMIHNSAVPMLRKNQHQSKNSRDLGLAYLITGVFYLLTGVVGTMGLYWRDDIQDAHTVLTNTLYSKEDSVTYYFAVASQVVAMVQLISVIPVLVFISRNQILTFVYGEDGDPPLKVSLIYNTLFLILCLGVQILNISPNTVMSIAGTSSGFVMIYSHPLGIHIKSLLMKKRKEAAGEKESLLSKEAQDFDLPDWLAEKKVNYCAEFFISGLLMAIGMFIFIISILSLFGINV